MKLSQAHHLALALIEHLAPACDRISIAGSIRRQKPDPKDCELVIIPRYRADLLTGNPAPVTDDVLAELISQGKLDFDQQVKRNGPKYKRLVHVASGLVFELFFCAPDNWGCIFALRTAPTGRDDACIVSEEDQHAHHQPNPPNRHHHAPRPNP